MYINTIRIAQDNIQSLKENEVFVFGSNIKGHHGGGAAYFAYRTFGAVWGVGEGLTGHCYALPTMEGATSFRRAVATFIDCAKQHPNLIFLVTAVGCGIAGYTSDEVAPMFRDAVNVPNVYLPKCFWDIIEEL